MTDTVEDRRQEGVHRRLGDILINLNNGLFALDRLGRYLSPLFPANCAARCELDSSRDFVQAARRDLHELYHTDQLTAPLIPFGIAERSEA